VSLSDLDELRHRNPMLLMDVLIDVVLALRVNTGSTRQRFAVAPCRIASRNFVTGCLSKDVTVYSAGAAFGSIRKNEAQSAAKSGRSPR
jgi:hypothetical protein